LTAAKPQSVFSRVTLDVLGIRTMVGGYGASSGLGYRTETTGQIYLLKENVALIGASTTNVTAATDMVIGYTYSNVGAYAFYLNGGAIGSGTNNQTISAVQIAIGIGAGSGYFKGVMAATVLYNVVPDATQAAELATAMVAL
jgi:hypothetical protein